MTMKKARVRKARDIRRTLKVSLPVSMRIARHSLDYGSYIGVLAILAGEGFAVREVLDYSCSCCGKSAEFRVTSPKGREQSLYLSMGQWAWDR